MQATIAKQDLELQNYKVCCITMAPRLCDNHSLEVPW